MRIFIFLLILLFLNNVVLSQEIFTKKGKYSAEGNSLVKFVVTKKNGNVQWQKSYDNENWFDIKGETKDSIRVKTGESAIYRAKVTSGMCYNYTDSAAVVTRDTINNTFIIPQDKQLTLLSDSVQISKGIYVYRGIIENSGFEPGKIIIDKQTGTLRKITDIQKDRDIAIVQTGQATMEDLFYNTSFKLSTKMMKPVINNLKSASYEEISKSLTDEEGYIHPVSISIYNENGSMLKSTSIYEINDFQNDNNLYFHKDLNPVFWNFNGSFSLADKKGNTNTYTGNSKCYLSDSYFTIDPEFKHELKFEWPKWSWSELEFIKKGKIKTFKFYSDESIIDIKLVLALESNISISAGKEVSLLPKPITYRANYLIGAVWLTVDYEFDLKVAFSGSFGGGLTLFGGAQNKTYVTLGVSYENDKWTPINDVSNTFTPIFKGTLNETLDVRVDLLPTYTAKFYTVAGPFMTVGPYINYGYSKSTNNNWDKHLKTGIDAQFGVVADLFDYERSKSFSLNLDESELWKSPSKLELIGGNNQTTDIGKQLVEPVTVRVLTSDNKPAEDVQVFFRPIQGKVFSGIVSTNFDGYAQAFWTMDDVPGINRMEVFLKDSKDAEMHDLKLDVRATGAASQIQIITQPVSNIGQNTAIGGGTITSDGGSEITARGVCWSSAPNPTTSHLSTRDGTGTGTFISNIFGLYSNTKYYVRAYAINKNGTVYGQQVEFTSGQNYTIPSLSTNPVSSITQSSAISGGVINSNGNSAISAKGVCWGTSTNPTTASNKTNEGTGIGSFTSTLTGLTANTIYYVRAYATNNTGTGYGNQVQFTAGTNLSIPTITTTAVTAITQSSATSGGILNSDGGAAVTAKGVCWATSANPTTASSKTSDGTGIAGFTSNLTGLSANTTYYIRAYATNSQGTGYGNQLQFTTGQNITSPVITTVAVSSVTQSSAVTGGNITSDGGAAVSTRGVCWATITNPTTASSKTTDGSGTGSFTSNLTGLAANTTYYLRAYATNSKGTAYGNEVVFTTQPIISLPALTTTAITGVTSSTAGSGGNITSDGGASVTARGVCWNTTGSPTTANSKTTDGNGTGSFTSSLAGLTASTTYYLRAYASNSLGTAFGNQVSFTTLASSGPEYGSFTDSRDGKSYKTVKIGTQTWMAENLAYLPSVSLISEGSNAIVGLPHYYVYGYNGNDVSYAKSTSNFLTYGTLYNYTAASTSCPQGWHLPSKSEWQTLFDYLGGTSEAAKKMKQIGLLYWNEPNDGTNESGFSALPGGCRTPGGFYNIKGHAYFVNPSLFNYGANAEEVVLNGNAIYFSNEETDYGFSVRCIKN